MADSTQTTSELPGWVGEVPAQWQEYPAIWLGPASDGWAWLAGDGELRLRYRGVDAKAWPAQSAHTATELLSICKQLVTQLASHRDETDLKVMAVSLAKLRWFHQYSQQEPEELDPHVECCWHSLCLGYLAAMLPVRTAVLVAGEVPH
jgi:hypothetical protein